MKMEQIQSPDGVSELMRELWTRHKSGEPPVCKVYEVMLPPPTDEERANSRHADDPIARKRDLVQGIEEKIIALIGDEIESLDEWAKDDKTRDEVEKLLYLRRNVLNQMFVPSALNLDRLAHINDYLFDLTNSLHARVREILDRQKLLANPDFDDDVMVEGRLRFIFDGVQSIKTLGDEDYYASNFPVMIKALFALHGANGQINVVSTYNGEDNLNDGDSWSEYPFHGPGYEGIVICHTVHDLTNHKLYSIPDLLRLNDFWNEVRITYQSLTDQDGNRRNSNQIY